MLKKILTQLFTVQSYLFFGTFANAMYETDWFVYHFKKLLKKCFAMARDQHGLGSIPTRAILLYPWKRHFTAHSPAWWSWQAVLNYSNVSIKLQAYSNILASPEAGRGNCLHCKKIL